VERLPLFLVEINCDDRRKVTLVILKEVDHAGPQRAELSDQADEQDTLYGLLLTPGVSTNECCPAFGLALNK
jgi:hypothetical protein